MPKQKKTALQNPGPQSSKTRSQRDERIVRALGERARRTRESPQVSVEQKPGKPLQVTPKHTDKVVGYASLLETFGTVETPFMETQLAALINASRTNPKAPVNDAVVNGMLAAINGLRLKDEVESMLATQMVAANHAAMDLFRRVGQSEYLESMTAYGNLAIKFLRTFNAQLEALQHYRGKGQQKIVVERVNVGEGGQAIVGHVQHGGPGGEGQQGAGSPEKTEDQSHAKHQADAPKPALRREDETGNPMPSAGGER